MTLLRDPTLPTLATVKAANRYQPSHLIRYRDDPTTAAYQIAFECGFLLRLYALPPQERVQLIGTARARERVAQELRRLRPDLPPARLPTVTDMLYDGLMLQLRSCGPGIEVDSRLFAQYPALRELQAASMTQQALTNAATLDPELDRQFPPALVQASRAMNSAYALFAAELLGQPHLAVHYQSAGLEALGRELLAVLFQGPGEGTPDRQIVDAWATTLDPGPGWLVPVGPRGQSLTGAGLMTPPPIHFQIEEQRFDLALLPAKARKPQTPAFRQAVTHYYRQAYAPLSGAVEVEFREGTISVTWRPAAAEQNPLEGILSLLQAGRYADARPMLEALLTLQPDDLPILYNLGMVYSDEGRLDEARHLLRRATQVAPDYANAFVALGVAALRANALAEAESALRQAVHLEPHNPFALRTLGTLRLMQGDAAAAVDPLRQAVRQAPHDPLALLSLAQALIEADAPTNSPEADELLLQVLALAPYGEIAEKAKNARRRLAQQTFRDGGRGTLRMDAVMYCLEGLKKFQGLSQAELAPILMEIATLGQKGLPVNDPTQKYRLRSLAGEFTALQLVCLLHVGIKQLDPSQDSSFDIYREYEAALAMYRDKGSTPVA